MPFYYELNPKKEEGKRTIERLLALRRSLERLPERTQRETLLLATWNIREFDSPKFGKRLDEAIYYIAEIIDKFDLVAIQEVHKNLTGMNRLMKVLGGQWKYVFTDTTEGRRGNQERMAFVYDTRKVRHSGLAGELVLPPVRVGGKVKPVPQFYRTPFICGFRAGWTKFMIATVHIQWGESKAEPEARIEEIRQLAQFLKKRTLDEDAWARNLILLGDFNIFRPENKTFQELVKAGFVIPEKIRRLPTSAMKARHYDQIAFRVRENSLEMTGKAGVYNFYNQVFRNEDQGIYEKYMPRSYRNLDTERKKGTYYRSNWRTHQMSDHLPLWVELKIDYSDEYLQYKLDQADGTDG